MTTSPDLSPDDDKEDDSPETLDIETPVDIRPDLSAIGIMEHSRGVCEDTFENRSILRSNQLGWDTVYATNGVPTGLIMARSKDMVTQRRLISLHEKKPILSDPNNKNSDYLTGLDLIAEPMTDKLVPTWVIGATRMWISEQDSPIATSKRKPTALPHRCTHMKDDGIRCMLWSSGRPKDAAMCRVHLRHVNKSPSDEIERARKKLVQSAPYAVDVLEELMQTATSEPVRLKASTEILDRAGVRGGVEVEANVNVTEARPATEIIAERLNRLAGMSVQIAGALAQQGVTVQPDQEVVEAEEVEVTGE